MKDIADIFQGCTKPEKREIQKKSLRAFVFFLGGKDIQA